jgi:hypothetical protein
MPEHFYNGFIKRAQNYGLSVIEAARLIKAAAPGLREPEIDEPRIGQVRENWNNTGYDLIANPPLPNPRLSSTSVTHHHGSITPMSFLQKHYGTQTQTELDKARKYNESKGFNSPGAIKPWSFNELAENSPDNLNTPMQVYTDHARPSVASLANAPANYRSLPEYTNQVIEPHSGIDSSGRHYNNPARLPYINLNSKSELPPYTEVSDPRVNQLASIHRTAGANTNHFLPNLTKEHTALLRDYRSFQKLPEHMRKGHQYEDFLKNTIEPLRKFHPYSPALAPNLEREGRDTFRHEVIHNYTRNQLHPDHGNLGIAHSDHGHFAEPVERATGLSSFQQDLYGQTGRRAESPEEFKKIIGGLLTAPDLEKAMNEQGFKGNTKRYLRFLKDSQLRGIPNLHDELLHDELMRQESELAPGFVQNTQPSPVSKIAAILKRRLS